MMLPLGFIPNEDPGYIMLQIDAPPGSTRAQMERSADDLNRAADASSPTSRTSSSSVGGGGGGAAAAMGGGGGGSRLNSGSAYVIMTDDHKMTTEELKQHLRPQFKKIPDIRVTALMTGGGPGGSDVNILLTSREHGSARKGADEPAQRDEGPADVIQQPAPVAGASGTGADHPAAHARKRRASTSRPTPSRRSPASRRPATSRPTRRNSPKASAGCRSACACRMRCATTSPSWRSCACRRCSGGTTTLGAVADLSYEPGPGNLQRLYRKRMASVQADFAPGIASGEATAAVDATPTMTAILKAEADGTAVVERARIGNEQAQAADVRRDHHRAAGRRRADLFGDGAAVQIGVQADRHPGLAAAVLLGRLLRAADHGQGRSTCR